MIWSSSLLVPQIIWSPLSSHMDVPQMIWSSLDQAATSPHIRGFGGIVVSRFTGPARFRSPNLRSDGLLHTFSRSRSDSKRMPVPLYRRADIEPASQYVAPLAPSPPSNEVVSEERPFAAILRDVQMFRLPAPAPISPPSRTNVAPDCSAILTCAVPRLGVPCSRSATAPVTIGAAMLVPLNCM